MTVAMMVIAVKLNLTCKIAKLSYNHRYISCLVHNERHNMFECARVPNLAKSMQLVLSFARSCIFKYTKILVLQIHFCWGPFTMIFGCVLSRYSLYLSCRFFCCQIHLLISWSKLNQQCQLVSWEWVPVNALILKQRSTATLLLHFRICCSM